MKIAIISDIHANIFALKKIIEDSKRNGCSYYLILGDFIGYYYWPKEVISVLKSLDATFIKGNHEDLLIKAKKNKSCRVNYLSKYGSGLEVCFNCLDKNDFNWIESLKYTENMIIDNVTISVAHGSLNSPYEYISSESNIEIETNSDFTFLGHTHHPFIHINKDGNVIANPGSVGQPRDIGSLSSYMILNTVNNVLINRRLFFDNKKLIDQINKIDPEMKYSIEVLKRNNQNV